MDLSGLKHESSNKGIFLKITKVIVFAISVVFLFYPSIVLAGESTVEYKQWPMVQIFTFLFLMLGPFKIIGPFAKVSRL